MGAPTCVNQGCKLASAACQKMLTGSTFLLLYPCKSLNSNGITFKKINGAIIIPLWFGFWWADSTWLIPGYDCCHHPLVMWWYTAWEDALLLCKMAEVSDLRQLWGAIVPGKSPFWEWRRRGRNLFQSFQQETLGSVCSAPASSSDGGQNLAMPTNK